MKSSEDSIKTRSTPASLTIQGQVTKDTTVKWSSLCWTSFAAHIDHDHELLNETRTIFLKTLKYLGPQRKIIFPAVYSFVIAVYIEITIIS